MRRRTWFVWHSWIGLTAGLLLFVICWSGAVAVFSRDLDRLLDRRLDAPAAVEMAWQPVFNDAKSRFPGWTINQIARPESNGGAAEIIAEDSDGVLRRILSDPGSGAVVSTTSYFNIQRFFRSFHMSLFIGELPIVGVPLGYFIVGLFAFVLLASGITSLVFYKRFWRGFFVLHRHRGARVFWSDLHKLVGLWSIWFLLLISLTGIWYLAEWWTPDGRAAPAAPGMAAEARALPLSTLIASGQRVYPELDVRVVATYHLGEGMIELQGQDGSALVRDRAAKVWVEAGTGKVLGVQRPADLSLYERWIETADPLHFGDFGGLLTKIIWFLFGLGLSGLCLTGAYLQAKRQQLRTPGRLRAPVLIAYGTTVAVLGLSTLFGVKEINGYAPWGANGYVTSGQLAFIGLWVASTLGAITCWMMSFGKPKGLGLLVEE